MNVNEAVGIAAKYVVSMESLSNKELEGDFNDALNQLRFAVEGTRYDEKDAKWFIEVGFTRMWDRAPRNALAGLSGASVAPQDNRTLKQVVVSDESGKVLSYGD